MSSSTRRTARTRLPSNTSGTSSVGFTNTSPGTYPQTVTVEFDLRITKVANQGDGISFAWLNSDVYGNSGAAPLFGWVQATWNLLERSAGPALAEAHAAGVKVIVKEGVANGRLAARGDVAPVKRLAAELGVTPDAVALAAALAQPWAHVVLSGAATVRQLEENAKAVGLKVDPGLLPELVEPPEAYWARRAQLQWT